MSNPKRLTAKDRVLRGLGALSLCTAAAFLLSREVEWAYASSLEMARLSGWVAAIGLALTLSAAPFGARLPSFKPWRRALGITTAVAAVAHALLSLTGPLYGSWEAVLSWTHLRAGAGALIILLLLLLTSFASIVRRLRVRHWKVLHRLVYAAALLVVAHLMLGPWGSVLWKSAMSAVLVTLLLWRLVAPKK